MHVLEQNYKSDDSTQKETHNDTLDRQTDEPALNTFRRPSPPFEDIDYINGNIREAKTSQPTTRKAPDDKAHQEVTFKNQKVFSNKSQQGFEETMPTNVTDRVPEFQNASKISQMSLQDYGDNML